ncbi:putative Oxidoreductase, molybdopterin binding [metagenome]|uniref:Putative Oxidoreductase, molybdopterin binding n=1 Tax=metagenome TaxID=256318 RepID=A0A2P2CFL4_9ZZZZ
MTASQRLLARTFEPGGRLQMAESRLAAHTEQGTPAEDLFLVHHYPRPDVSSLAKLVVVGSDGTSVTLGHDEIRELPRHDVLAVLECAGNGRGLRATRTPGNQFGLGLFGQSRWTGARLSDVLAAAGVADDTFASLIVSSLDEGVTQPEGSHDRFAKALPRDKVLHPDTLVAWQLDGEELPVEHGGPLRLVVPGWYGIWWAKWPEELRLSDEPYDAFDGFWQSTRYTYQDAEGNVQAVVRDQLPRAVVTSPADGADVSGEPELEILAWAGEYAVATVEVSVDDGVTWLPAELVGRAGSWGWSTWRATLTGLPRGLRRVAVRARDDADRTQDWQPADNRLGYGNNGIHVVQLDLTAVPA